MAMKLGANINLDKVVKSLGAKYKLVPHLDLAIGEGDFEWHFDYEPKRGDDAWHPSGDCTPSLHDLYLKATGQAGADVISPGLRKIFMIGHFWHQYLQWVVTKKLGFASAGDIERRGHHWWGEPVAPKSDMTPKKSGEPRWDDTKGRYPGFYDKELLYYLRYPECTYRADSGEILGTNEEFMKMARTWPGVDMLGNGMQQVKVRPQPYHWVTGSADIAPCTIPGHGEFLVDFKTVNPRMFAVGMSADYLAKWECQANIYLDFFGLERAIFVLIDKPGGDMKEIEFEHNPELVESLYDKWQLVSACLDEGIEPPEDEPWELPLKGIAAR